MTNSALLRGKDRGELHRGAIAVLGLEDRVQEVDERFAAMLYHREIRVWQSAGEDPWWDFGYPRNAGKALLRDLGE